MLKPHWQAKAPSNIALIKYMGKRFYAPFAPERLGGLGAAFPKAKSSSAQAQKGLAFAEAKSSSAPRPLESLKEWAAGREPDKPSVKKGQKTAFSAALEETGPKKPHFEELAPCFFKKLSDKERAFLRFSNLSLNPSLSYTLSHFQAVARIEPSERDGWRPFQRDPFQGEKLFHSSKKIDFEKGLSERAQNKFMDFFGLLKRFFDLPGHYTVFSESNFPLSAGLASSAASFSALTRAVFRLAQDRSPFKKQLEGLSWEALSSLSRAGSGSSCRSFFSPWALWEGQGAIAFKTPWPRLIHQLVLIDPKVKSTSSTEAHQRVASSPLFEGRANRAVERLGFLTRAFRQKDWLKGFQLCFDEFLDMHSLFETASPPFKYINPAVEKALSALKDFWRKEGDGPWVTMDAGANIHLLWRPDQQAKSLQIKALLGDYAILCPS